MNEPIRVGQVWESRDHRETGRRVTVEQVGGCGVTVRSVRRSSLRHETLRRYYRLVQDVPEVTP